MEKTNRVIQVAVTLRFDEAVRERMRKFMEFRGYKSQNSFAEACGIGSSQMSQIMQGNTTLTEDAMNKICKAMNVSPEEFLKEILAGKLNQEEPPPGLERLSDYELLLIILKSRDLIQSM